MQWEKGPLGKWGVAVWGMGRGLERGGMGKGTWYGAWRYGVGGVVWSVAVWGMKRGMERGGIGKGAWWLQ